jgi:sigma-B regulation protein RsbU (phosphoserine phosphatase)
MYAPTPELSANQVLQAFHRDAPFLFLGAAIVAVGLVAAAFSAIRRKHDLLLIYLALFAILYGLRMWMQSDLLLLTMRGSAVYWRFSSALNLVIPIPAFLFLNAAGFLRRDAKIAGYVLGIVLGSLTIATLAFGPHHIFDLIENVLVIAAMWILAARSIGGRSPSRDFVVIRRGLLIWVAFVLWENMQGVLGYRFRDVEPIGFVAFLAALGYVAARQTLQRDLEFGEIQKELEVARRIQLSILPGAFPESDSFRVAARYVPMTSVAGDFYDFLVADDAQAGLLIADVSGHGVPAALIASMVKVAATSQRTMAGDPARLLAGMNTVLCGNTQNQFVTAAYVHLDAASRTLRYSAAGHPPMLLLRNGNVTEIVENGLMLAAFEFATYKNAAYPLEPGDRLLLYTDGLIEAANANGDFFGQDALSALLRQTAGLPLSGALDQIISAVQRWAAAQNDDLTVLICDYAPSRLESCGAG